TKEIPFFDKLEKDGKISLFKLRALNSHNKPVELKEFTSFWNTPLNVAHFACHAFYKEDMPASSHILLSDEFAITIMDMEVYDIKIAGHPLIIINACKTGNLNPLYTSYFAAVFLKYGARGVVATECSVPDSFAADFAKTLYSYLLAGQPLGLSLLASRRYFMINYSNPSGLLYSMYASPAIRFVQVGG
ncbi:MAG TPA: CHAT domain-containing protein, partial [Herpetosiphonaceae bacterium]